MKKEFIVERQGKSFVLYAGLLDEAHRQGLKSISTSLVQAPSEANGNVAICQAVVETEKGTFTGIGDASPRNVSEMMRTCLIRMAETRAKARALRDAVNVGVAALEELEGAAEFPATSPRAGTRRGQTAGLPARHQDPATQLQLRAIRRIALDKLGLDEKGLEGECQAAYQVALAELSKQQASELIDRLKARTSPSGERKAESHS
jgi:hypothetical protein